MILWNCIAITIAANSGIARRKAGNAEPICLDYSNISNFTGGEYPVASINSAFLPILSITARR